MDNQTGDKKTADKKSALLANIKSIQNSNLAPVEKNKAIRNLLITQSQLLLPALKALREEIISTIPTPNLEKEQILENTPAFKQEVALGLIIGQVIKFLEAEEWFLNLELEEWGDKLIQDFSQLVSAGSAKNSEKLLLDEGQNILKEAEKLAEEIFELLHPSIEAAMPEPTKDPVDLDPNQNNYLPLRDHMEAAAQAELNKQNKDPVPNHPVPVVMSGKP